MKVVIIEGMDNTGKTTVIHGLMEKYNNVYYMHAVKPDIKDPIKCAIAQQDAFIRMANDVVSLKRSGVKVDLVILDRSWVGEYVYGCLYRGNGDDFVKSMINDCYMLLRNAGTGLFPLDFSTILYTASPEFCTKNDDGKSISKGRIEAIKKEGERFLEIVKSGCVVGKKAIINVEDEDGNFKSKEAIIDMTLKVIDDHQDNNLSTDLLYVDGILQKDEEKEDPAGGSTDGDSAV